MTAPGTVLLIACGALAREVAWVIEQNGWSHMQLTCLPADLHNRPQHLPDAMRKKIRAARETGRYTDIFAVFGDCGTGGLLDAVLLEEGVERLPGAHCYEFLAGPARFVEMTDEEIGSFYLTDYLVRHFDRLIIKGLGLDRFPHLRDDYFGHYKRVVYLAQTEDEALQEKARAAAARLGLDYVLRPTGFNSLTKVLQEQTSKTRAKDNDHVLEIA